jgi:opacity protein-like surface antigen
MRLAYSSTLRLILALLAVLWASAAIAAPPPQPLDLAPGQGATSLQDLDDALDDLSAQATTDAATQDGITRRVYRRYYRPAPQQVVIVQRPTTTVITRGYSDPPIYARAPQRTGVAVGLRFATLSLGDTTLQYETFEGASLLGIGGYIRGMFDPHLGIELGVDVLGADERAYSQFTVPVMAGLFVSLFPDSFVNAYGIAGGGVIFNNIEYYGAANGRAGVDESYVQFAGQLGAGVELNIGNLQVSADLRWLFLQARPERDGTVRAAVPLADTQATTANTQSLSSVTNALQFNIGVGGAF